MTELLKENCPLDKQKKILDDKLVNSPIWVVFDFMSVEKRTDTPRINLRPGKVLRVEIEGLNGEIVDSMKAKVVEALPGVPVVRIELVGGHQTYELLRDPIEETGQVGVFHFHEPSKNGKP